MNVDPDGLLIVAVICGALGYLFGWMGGAIQGAERERERSGLDAARYRKLRGWMSSNVPEGWQQALYERGGYFLLLVHAERTAAPSFDKLMDSFAQELIDMPDAEILDGKDPAQALAEGRAILQRAKEAAAEKVALDAFNAYWFKCTPGCTVATWMAAFKAGVKWATDGVPSDSKASADAVTGNGEA